METTPYNLCMVDKRKTGVGLLTCARPQTFAKLFRDVVSNPSIDFVVVVKNRSEDYGDLSPTKLAAEEGNGKAVVVEIPEDVGVGCCKNVALMRMIQAGCSHLFLAEDDMEIVDPAVFEIYAKTAVAFGLHHLNFGACWDDATKSVLAPVCLFSKKDTGEKLDVYARLCGAFSYYSSIAIWQAGLIDSKRFVNAMDHVEHTYRISIMDLTLPYGAFADVHESKRFLAYSEAGKVSTLEDAKSQHRISCALAAAETFKKRYGMGMKDVPVPDVKELAKKLNADVFKL